MEAHFPAQCLYQIFYATFLRAKKNYICLHIGGHHAKIVRTVHLLANVDQNILPLDQSGCMEIVFSKASTNPHITVAAFIRMLTANEMIQLTCITKKLHIKYVQRRYFRQLFHNSEFRHYYNICILLYLIHFQSTFTYILFNLTQ